MDRRKLIRYAIVILLIGVALWQTYPYFGDLITLFRYRGLNYWWIVAATCVQLAQYGGDGYLIRRLLAILGFDVRLKDTVRISALDVFAIRFMPVGSFGSLVAFVYFYRKLGVSTQAVIYLNLFLTVISVFELLVLFIISLATLHTTPFPVLVPSSLLGALAIAALIVLAILFVVLGSEETRQSLNQWLLRYPWYVSLRKTYDEIRTFAGVAAAQRVRFIELSALKNLTIYACDVAILLCCGLAFHTWLSPFVVLFAYVVSLVAGTLSLSPGGLGVTDATMTILLVAGGVTPAVTIGVVLLNRIVSFLVPLPLGGLAYFTLKRDIGSEPTPADRSHRPSS
jgi:uncharacterized protein (TIRG00374 family)